ncbi:hypothetical protein GDO86_006722 [Hymenochirus boettgeri]|uniref:Uncharacterized protein n=1 Tax=Hymenochirus boettgeri TaxID=247094 RepID=A0A8T2J9Q7_9PIPI|nr:hypothetical protein GDO86_006722 [Hymenochirus boettgeri]
MQCKLPLLLQTLLKFIYDVSSDPRQYQEPVAEALRHHATECLILLDRCCNGQVKMALEEIPSICREPHVIQCIRRVQEDT